SLAGLALGLAAGSLDPLFRGYADLFPADGENYHLALWHGIEPALAISAVTLVVGLLLFWQRATVSTMQARVPVWINSADGYWRVLRFVDRTAARLTSTTQRGSLPFYLGTI